MADNSSDLLPWMYGCISEAAFARENDAVTRALRMSLLSAGGSSSSSIPAASASAAAATSILLPLASRDQFLRWEPPAGRIGKKRKPRASKRSPTTYIAADPANFRELVQQVTGPRSADAGGEIPISLPLPLPLEPPPPPAQGTSSCLLPTLDTSAFLVDRVGPGRPLDGGGPDSSPVLLNFPTVDSWGVM